MTVGGSAPGTATRIALDDARRAVFEHDDACSWFESVADGFSEPLAVEVWVFDRDLSQVLLVEHRWRGWMPPGGAVEPDERPRDAATRELLEETGLRVDLADRPAAVAVRSFHPDWPEILALSYASIVDPAVALRPEPGQPAAWRALADAWEGAFPEDRERMVRYVSWLVASGT